MKNIAFNIFQFFLIILGFILLKMGWNWYQAIYIVSGIVIVIIIFLNVFLKVRIYSKWWSLSLLTGCFFAGYSFDLFGSWMISVLILILSLGIYIFFFDKWLDHDVPPEM